MCNIELAIGLVYLSRLINNGTRKSIDYVTPRTACSAMGTALLLSYKKYQTDERYLHGMQRWAVMAGQSRQQIIHQEETFCKEIDWRLEVAPNSAALATILEQLTGEQKREESIERQSHRNQRNMCDQSRENYGEETYNKGLKSLNVNAPEWIPFYTVQESDDLNCLWT